MVRHVRLPPGRLVGIDVARCLALLGMVATHVLDPRDPDGSLALSRAVASGRASALFAVLAGVSLALVTGRREPARGSERRARSAGVAVRALLIAITGLLIGALDSGLAVILTHYGLLFCLGLPFVGLRAPALAGLAGLWAVLAPVLSHLLRPQLPPRTFGNPTLLDLGDPVQLLSTLCFTGYYPVVPWLSLLLTGLAVGRLDLSRRRVHLALVGTGAGLAVTATLLSRWATSRPGVVAALLADPAGGDRSGPALLDRISPGLFGSTPTGGAWQWLLVVAPHSGTPFDLVQTAGSAVAVIGGCLAVVAVLPRAAVVGVAVFFGAGTMTLSLYTLHVVTRTPDVWPPERPDSYVWHVLLLLGIGAGYVALGRRGPLERLVAAASSAAAEGSRRKTAPASGGG